MQLRPIVEIVGGRHVRLRQLRVQRGECLGVEAGGMLRDPCFGGEIPGMLRLDERAEGGAVEAELLAGELVEEGAMPSGPV
jgi:hypothetical protein